MDGSEQIAASEGAPVSAGGGPSTPPASRERAGTAPLAAALEKALSVEFRAALVEVLQTPLEVRFRGLEECAWADFLGSVEERSCCLGLARQAWLEISPQIAFPIIDRLLGGSGREWYVPSRALTAIERGLLQRVGELAARCLGNSGPLSSAGAEDGGGSDVSEPQGPAVLAKFTLSMGRQAGALRLCLPRALAERMAAGPGGAEYAPAARTPASQPPAASGPLELSVVVQDIRVTAEELARLGEGDLLVTDTPADGEVLVRIGGIPRFYARLGASNGRKAIRITRRIDP